ncbi:MAG: helicase HerA-like domain-containing protein, partial [Limisphaerales bacterium]
MQDYEKLGVFYLGRHYQLEQRQRTDEVLLYDSKHLVTHGLVVGMTGSGKTGLCFDLIEEAAIDGIPSIVIDPKGDLGNLLLTFPGLRPEDFAPWVNEEDAQKAGLSVADFAAQQAELWRKGLASWDQDGARIGRLRAAAEFALYTPGSRAGLPMSILSSFAPPPAEILEDRELLRERVNSTVASLLGLVGGNADPVKSRECILLSTLLQQAWVEGRVLDLAALIHEVQTPPVRRIGVLDLEVFYPAKDRFELAM